MLWTQVLEVVDVLDDPGADGERVADLLRRHGAEAVRVDRVEGEEGGTDFVRVEIPGASGRRRGGPAPTLGLVGRLGGVGARPARIGMVSDADGAVAVLAAAAKLAGMARRGDHLPGDVLVATQVSPSAPTVPHEPVPFMGSAVDMDTKNAFEVDPAMDAVVSVDTTRGTRVVNHVGVAVSPTVRQGYLLRVAEDLLDVVERVTGRPAVVLPLTIQDITPYGNGVYHLNSILQPSVATVAPVVGLAITAEAVVAGSATGANDLAAVEAAARVSVEIAKDFTAGRASFYDPDEFDRLVALYGPLTFLQGSGRPAQASGPTS